MRTRSWKQWLWVAALASTSWSAQAASPMINAPDGHTLAVDRFGAVYAWGANGAGQLGNGTNTPSPTPIIVPGLSGIVSVAGGSAGSPTGFSFAVRSDGVLFAWGFNGQGQLGLGNTATGPTSPTQIPSFANVLQVAGGDNFAVAVKKDGTVWAWGDNTHGQLGKGDNFASSSPLQVAGLGNIVKVVAGLAHVLALRADGTVFAWGYNGFGQVGNGGIIDSLVPVQVGGLAASVIDIAAAPYESWSALADGSVYGWGLNIHGEMCDLTITANRTTPVRALGFLPRTVKLGSSSSRGNALQAHALDGRLWKCGWNGFGQLGDGYSSVPGTDDAAPQMLSGAPNQGVMASSSGITSHLVRVDGSVRGWGYNPDGETGTTAAPGGNVLTPAPVLGVGAAGQLNLGNFDGRKSNFNGANADGWLFWRFPSVGANTLWRLQGNTVVTNQPITAVGSTWSVAGTGDLNGDGKADIVWVEAGGTIVVWLMNGTAISSSAVIGNVPAGWSLVAVGDLNGDGKDDLVFRETSSGTVAVWEMDGVTVRNVSVIGTQATNFQLAWLADFDGNGIKDILWFDPATGTAQVWQLFRTDPITVWNLGTLGPGWTPALVGDFNGDGRADILWRNASTNAVWYMAAGVVMKVQLLPAVQVNWTPVAVMDSTGAGRDDIIWLDSASGAVVRWQMNGIDANPTVNAFAVQGIGWQVVGQH